MKTTQRVLLSIGAAILTALLGAFWFWSMGCQWVPGPQLGLAVGTTIPASIGTAAATFMFTPKSP